MGDSKRMEENSKAPEHKKGRGKMKAEVMLGIILAFAGVAGIGAVKKNLPVAALGCAGYSVAAVGLAGTRRNAYQPAPAIIGRV
jgi:hypothetical protein